MCLYYGDKIPEILSVLSEIGQFILANLQVQLCSPGAILYTKMATFRCFLP